MRNQRNAVQIYNQNSAGILSAEIMVSDGDSGVSLRVAQSSSTRDSGRIRQGAGCIHIPRASTKFRKQLPPS